MEGMSSFKLLGKDFASIINLELAIGVGTLEPVAGAGCVKETHQWWSRWQCGLQKWLMWAKGITDRGGAHNPIGRLHSMATACVLHVWVRSFSSAPLVLSNVFSNTIFKFVVTFHFGFHIFGGFDVKSTVWMRWQVPGKETTVRRLPSQDSAPGVHSAVAPTPGHHHWLL